MVGKRCASLKSEGQKSHCNTFAVVFFPEKCPAQVKGVTKSEDVMEFTFGDTSPDHLIMAHFQQF